MIDVDEDVSRPPADPWVYEAIRVLEADAQRTSDTHLYLVPLRPDWDVQLYVKDEAAHPTGSLKHRLARSLILYGLCNGWIGPGTTLVEASSGSTAVSEAYFARMLGLPFVAVLPEGTSQTKVDLIEAAGGHCHFVTDPRRVYDEAERLAAELGGHYLDQFTFAERATDWRGNNNIAESVIEQMRLEPHPVPAWIVVGAGTGGTSATLGRFLRYKCLPTRVAVVDPEGSAFFECWARGEKTSPGEPSRIEGIGRPRPEPSFIPEVIDRMIRVPDAASLAAMAWLRDRTGLWAGGSTGTNLWGSLVLAAELAREGVGASVVTLMCDRGDRYAGTYFDLDWRRRHGLEEPRYRQQIDELLGS